METIAKMKEQVRAPQPGDVVQCITTGERYRKMGLSTPNRWGVVAVIMTALDEDPRTCCNYTVRTTAGKQEIWHRVDFEFAPEFDDVDGRLTLVFATRVPWYTQLWRWACCPWKRPLSTEKVKVSGVCVAA